MIASLVIVWLARKAFKTDPEQAAERYQRNDPRNSELSLDLFTQIFTIDRNVQDVLHMIRTPEGRSRLEMLSEQVAIMNKLLRKRGGRSKKLGIPDDGDSPGPNR